jgi:CRP/FNR family transcriptional regulator
MLFREGEPSQGCYLVQSGAVNVHRVNAAGREQVIHIFRAGESLAEASLASTTGYPANARAVEAGTVLLIPKTPILELIGRRPDLALRMLGSMSQHLRVLVGALDDLTLKDVETRLLNWLLKHGRGAPDGTIRLPSTKRVLAAELGTSSETLSRTFARLRTEGLLEIHGNTLRTPNLPAIEGRFRQLLGEG